MTAFATIFALIPMALGLTGEGGFISKPLAVVVIGGLVSSTLLTLVLVPALYTMIEGRRERRAQRKARKRSGGRPATRADLRSSSQPPGGLHPADFDGATLSVADQNEPEELRRHDYRPAHAKSTDAGPAHARPDPGPPYYYPYAQVDEEVRGPRRQAEPYLRPGPDGYLVPVDGTPMRDPDRPARVQPRWPAPSETDDEHDRSYRD
jgi:hypothetical protein